MIFRAILPDEIQVGDVIQIRPTRLPYTVEGLGSRCEDVMTIRVAGQREYVAHPRHSYVRLLHRPLPEGKTELDLLKEIHRLMNLAVADGISGVISACQEIHEATEAYELGKPLERK